MSTAEILKSAENYGNVYGLVCIPIGETKDKKPKAPLCEGWQLLTKTQPALFRKHARNLRGVAVQTGANSNIWVLDIDKQKEKDKGVKADGVAKWKELTDKYGEPDTAQVRTPSGAYHYYFAGANYINSCIGFGGYTIDILNATKCAVMPPTTGYEWVKPLENIKPAPEWLINFIHETYQHEAVKKITKRKTTHALADEETKAIQDDTLFYPYTNKTAHKVKHILNNLDKSHKIEFDKWFTVTCCMKSYATGNDEADANQIKTMWDNWSKKDAPNYNKVSNNAYWDAIKKPLVNINYLVHLYNKSKKDIREHMKKFNQTRKFDPLDGALPPIKIMEDVKNKYIDAMLTDEIRKLHNVIIVKAPTGSGKTTTIIYFIKKEIEQKTNCKIVSIVSRRTLADAHESVFNENKINMDNYQTVKDVNDSRRLVIEVESLHKLDEFEYRGCILFLDEFNSLLKTIETSDTIRDKRTIIYDALKTLINGARRVYAVDADMTAHAINFICENRDDQDKILYYHNMCPNYKGCPATNYLCEKTARQKIISLIFDQKKNGIICFDSKNKLDEEYAQILRDEASRRGCLDWLNDKLMLYTADIGDRADIKQINEKWADKIVLFSPTIIYGLDYNSKKPEFVFIIAKNRTLNALELVQQANRSRNISELHYYVEPNDKQLQYTTIGQLKEHYNNMLNGYRGLLEFKNETASRYNKYKKHDDQMLLNLCENGGVISVNDTFYKVNDNSDATFTNLLITYNFHDAVLKSNTEYHLTKILQNKGFNVSFDTTIAYDDEDEQKELKQLKEKAKADKEVTDAELCQLLLNGQRVTSGKNQVRAEQLQNTLSGLKINDIETFDKYHNIIDNVEISEKPFSDIVTDAHALKQHYKFCLLCKNEKSALQIADDKQNKEFDVHLCKNDMTKILTIMKLESAIDMKRFDTVIDRPDEPATVNEYEYIKKLFRITADKQPTTRGDVHVLVMKLYKNIDNDVILDNNKVIRKGKTTHRTHQYEINKLLLKTHLLISGLRKTKYQGYDDEILTLAGIDRPKDAPIFAKN